MAESARIEELRRRVQLDPASIAFAALAEEYRRNGQFEDAVAACEAGLQRHPAYISARVTLGRSLLELGRFEDARHELELVLRTAPENLAAIRALAEIHDRVGDYSDTQFAIDAAKASQAGSAAPAPEPPRPAAVSTPPHRPIPLSGSPVAASKPIEPARVAPSPIPAAAPAPPPPPPRPALEVSPKAPAPARVPHPDEAALPALEAFLAAIQSARTAGPQSE